MKKLIPFILLLAIWHKADAFIFVPSNDNQSGEKISQGKNYEIPQLGIVWQLSPTLHRTKFSNCVLIGSHKVLALRSSLTTKTNELFAKNNLEIQFGEQFYTVFQIHPVDDQLCVIILHKSIENRNPLVCTTPPESFNDIKLISFGHGRIVSKAPAIIDTESLSANIYKAPLFRKVENLNLSVEGRENNLITTQTPLFSLTNGDEGALLLNNENHIIGMGTKVGQDLLVDEDKLLKVKTSLAIPALLIPMAYLDYYHFSEPVSAGLAAIAGFGANFVGAQLMQKWGCRSNSPLDYTSKFIYANTQAAKDVEKKDRELVKHIDNNNVFENHFVIFDEALIRKIGEYV